jgi:hypothetical protein
VVGRSGAAHREVWDVGNDQCSPKEGTLRVIHYPEERLGHYTGQNTREHLSLERRALLAGLAAAGATAALPSSVSATPQSVPLGKAFEFLDSYYGISPAKRDRFHLAYYAVRNRKFAPDLKATIVAADGGRTPLALARDAHVDQLPTLAGLKSSATLQFDAAPSDKVGLALALEPTMPIAARLDARGLAAAIVQAEAGVTSLAGLLSFAAPKITVAMFPGAGSGQVELDNGYAAPLPVTENPFWGQVPYYDPAQLAGARIIVLARAPSRILLDQHPK